jgi:hypothetical protein
MFEVDGIRAGWKCRETVTTGHLSSAYNIHCHLPQYFPFLKLSLQKLWLLTCNTFVHKIFSDPFPGPLRFHSSASPYYQYPAMPFPFSYSATIARSSAGSCHSHLQPPPPVLDTPSVFFERQLLVWGLLVFPQWALALSSLLILLLLIFCSCRLRITGFSIGGVFFIVVDPSISFYVFPFHGLME